MNLTNLYVRLTQLSEGSDLTVKSYLGGRFLLEQIGFLISSYPNVYNPGTEPSLGVDPSGKLLFSWEKDSKHLAILTSALYDYSIYLNNGDGIVKTSKVRYPYNSLVSFINSEYGDMELVDWKEFISNRDLALVN